LSAAKGPENHGIEKKKPKNKKPIEIIGIGDLLQTSFSEKGRFTGVQLRNELIIPLYEQHDHDPKKLTKALKVCAFINRLLTDGMKDEFALVQIKDGEHWKNLKEFRDIDCQVTDSELDPKGIEEIGNAKSRD